MRQRLHRPSPSLLVAIAAVVIACAGTAWAATVITSKQIKNGTIQLVDLDKGARTALQGGRGPQGPVGPAGANGTIGKDGAPGAPGAPGVSEIITTSTGLGLLTGSKDVMSLSLPAGSWMIHAHVGGAHNDTVRYTRIECLLSYPGGSLDFAKLRFPPNTSATDSLVFADINLQGAVTLTETTIVKTACYLVPNDDTGFTLTTHTMTAIRGTSVVTQ
jgi:hypothetical protein